MVDMYHDDLPAFNARYHQRSVIEVVFGAIKKMYGSYVRCRRPDNQRCEIPYAHNLLQHRVDRTVTGRKWQAHTPVA